VGCQTLQISPGAKRSSFTPKDGHICAVVSIESDECLIEGFSVLWVDCVAHLGA
jgi:hypothetical protein